jgi:excisionase family DNA binding protein
MERVLLTVPEVAEALQVGRCMVYDLIRTGRLESVKIGKLRRVRPEALREFTQRVAEEEISA